MTARAAGPRRPTGAAGPRHATGAAGPARPARTARSAPRARAPVGLSHDKIVTAALRMIDRHGLAGFSTRKLGAALRCEAMALYWYFPSKEALLDAVVARLVAPLGAAATAGPAGLDWLEALRRVARAYRDIAREHPHAFALLATRRFASAGAYGFLEQLLALAEQHGVPPRTAARTYRVVSSYCNGFALNELAGEREADDPGIAKLRSGFPRVDAAFAWLGPEHLDDTFEHGLDLLLGALRPGRTAR
ncbi:MAG: TetR/AcrR family transcriptional regulator C-terminal domain-containing protein [Deltaproteobacteria bacterium]|nr:TetR/AcrR family transcriptional regulator C-terminal domain-containing protein [Deltaproteobacteria bacterium]